MADSDLSPRHQKFVDEYILTGCGSEAYRRAGFYGRTAHVVSNNANRLMARDVIKEAIAKRQQQINAESLLTLVEKKKILADMAVMGATKTDKGRMVDAPSALGAIRELNRMEGHYAPIKTQTTTGHVTFIQQIAPQLEEKPAAIEIIDQSK